MAMTSAELRALGLAMFGVEWKSPLARAIGCSLRTIQRIAADEQPLSDNIEARIRKSLGATDKPDAAWPRDEWIMGEGQQHAPGERREYLIHTVAPRFVARVVAIDPVTDLPETHEGETDNLTGIVYASGDSELCEIVWIDAPPGPANLARLMDAAADALENI